MELRLKEIRSRRGLSQDELANMLGIKKSRYGTWERGERMMSLEQAYNCAVVLGCTLNDLVGMSAENLAPDELDLVECYRAATPRERQSLLFTAETFRDGGRAKNNPVPGKVAVGA
ncbi:MAG TPA: hypothetical protein DCP91_01690 [Eggerthellaceae bacterium]|nr:hypothetical protein [Eggerthellaceae bacterium]